MNICENCAVPCQVAFLQQAYLKRTAPMLRGDIRRPMLWGFVASQALRTAGKNIFVQTPSISQNSMLCTLLQNLNARPAERRQENLSPEGQAWCSFVQGDLPLPRGGSDDFSSKRKLMGEDRAFRAYRPESGSATTR